MMATRGMRHYNPPPPPPPRGGGISAENFNTMLEKMKMLEQRVIQLEKNSPKIPFKFVSDREEEERARVSMEESMARMRRLVTWG